MKLPQQLISRDPNTTKLDYGHAFLAAGSYGKMGCAVLSARACLRVGAGLLTVHLPQRSVDVMQVALPEAMVSIDSNDSIFSNVDLDLSRYAAVAAGPGLGTDFRTTKALLSLMRKAKNLPVILDADAINMLAKVNDGKFEGLKLDWESMSSRMVLTPHEREYERLFGEESPAEVSRRLGVVLVCKSHHTHVYSPQGDCYINDTGNPGMATAGSGDVLSGIILGLLSQGVQPFEAAKLGVYLHGLAGDCAAAHLGQASMIAGDIVDHLPEAIMKIGK